MMMKIVSPSGTTLLMVVAKTSRGLNKKQKELIHVVRQMVKYHVPDEQILETVRVMRDGMSPTLTQGYKTVLRNELIRPSLFP